MSAKTSSNPENPAHAARPVTVTVAAVVAAVEGALLAAWGVYMIIEGVAGDPDSPMQAELGGVTVLAIAALPLVAALGLLRTKRWGRGPTLIMQVLALPVAWTMGQSGGAMIAAAAVLGVLAVVGLVCLIHPATTEALEGPAER